MGDDANTRMRTVSGAMFAGERHRLTQSCMHWKLTLDDAIDRTRLQAALDAALVTCPYMGYSVETDGDGMWCVPNLSPMEVLDEAPATLGGEDLGGHLSCLVCHGRSLEVVVYHGLTDGVGMSWFLDALLAAYFGDGSAAYQGVGTPDYARDPMAHEFDLPKGYAAAPVMPEGWFALPEATGRADDRHLLSFARSELKEFCSRHDCSTTTALLTLLGMAIERVHPENDDLLVVRCPVNSRQMLGMPHTFMNASMPQVLVQMDARSAREGDAAALAVSCAGQISSQANRDHVAFSTNQVAAALRRERSEQVRTVMDAFKAPVVLSNLGTIARGPAGRHIVTSEFWTYGIAPLMANLTTANDMCHLVLTQTFASTAYADALASVIAEQAMATQGDRTEHLSS